MFKAEIVEDYFEEVNLSIGEHFIDTLDHFEDVERELAASESFMKRRKSKRALRWNKLIDMEPDFEINSAKFRAWDKTLDLPDQDKIAVDVVRTRSALDFCSRPSVQHDLELLLTFFCKSKNVPYQQGMQEVAIIFLLLKSQTMRLETIYSFFEAFMSRYLPAVLKISQVTKKRSLPALHASVHMFSLLLRYHDAELAEFFRVNQVPVSLFATSWFMTLFAAKNDLQYVYELWNMYIEEDDPMFVFFLAVAMIKLEKRHLITLTEDELLSYVTKELKFRSSKHVEITFNLAKELHRRTPESVIHFAHRNGVKLNASFQSVEEMALIKRFSKENVLSIFPAEIYRNHHLRDSLTFFINRAGGSSRKGRSGSAPKLTKLSTADDLMDEVSTISIKDSTVLDSVVSDRYVVKLTIVDEHTKNIDWKFIDVRNPNSRSFDLPDSISLKSGEYKNRSSWRRLVEIAQSLNKEYHFCIVCSKALDELSSKTERKLYEYLTRELRSGQAPVNHVSVLEGGFSALVRTFKSKADALSDLDSRVEVISRMQTEPDSSERKHAAVEKKKKSSKGGFFKGLKKIFTKKASNS